jgi:hypothetical protein
MWIPIYELARRLDRSPQALRHWKRKGCGGFELVNNRLLCDPEVIASWRLENNASKPGPKRRR